MNNIMKAISWFILMGKDQIGYLWYLTGRCEKAGRSCEREFMRQRGSLTIENEQIPPTTK